MLAFWQIPTHQPQELLLDTLSSRLARLKTLPEAKRVNLVSSLRRSNDLLNEDSRKPRRRLTPSLRCIGNRSLWVIGGSSGHGS